MSGTRKIAKRAQAMQRRRAISHRLTTGAPHGLMEGDVIRMIAEDVCVKVVFTKTPCTLHASRLGAKP